MKTFAAIALSAAMATATVGVANAQASAPIPSSLAVGGGLTAGAVAGIVIVIAGVAYIISNDGTVTTTAPAM
ncbi:MAG: hypothetical protein ACK4S2_01385 [Gemmobacter sp.]|uniref:hypothetical protein n=1 Tax=Gemmobacter sp. TaxID=1898957 RepID=UPI00391D201C